MVNISVRKIDDATMQQLRFRAAEHGVSTEEEVRRILREAVAAPVALGDLAVGLFGKDNGVEIELPERNAHEPMVIPE